MRVEAETKREIEQAAERKGLSLTTFILDAVTRAAAKANSDPPVSRFRGVPTWFKASCTEASKGGTSTYKNLGYNFASKLTSLAPYELEDAEWESELEKLQDIVLTSALSEPDDEAVAEWLYKYFPKCINLIPKRRMGQFLKGMYEFVHDEGIVF